MAPRVAVSYFPPAENSAGLRGLKDWTAVSTWLSGLVDPPAELTEPVRAKAAQLTANASSEMEKIRPIAAFVQQTKYVAISLNLTRGGGYTPRRSDDVLSKNYGAAVRMQSNADGYYAAGFDNNSFRASGPAVPQLT